MPDLPNNVPRYEPDQPYYYTFDNTPIDALIQRDDIINNQVDINTALLEQAGGTAGTLPTRLNQSMDTTGALKATAINVAEHNIGYHTDGAGADSIQYVRMKLSERDKLTTVSEYATSFGMKVQLPSTIVPYDSDFVTFAPSPTITWSVGTGQVVSANVVAQPDGHIHYDNITPVDANPTPDYLNYETGIASPFLSGSLCVYINGVRIFDGGRTVKVPSTNPLTTWNSNGFTVNPDLMSFVLNTAITASDVIVIDFIVSAS